MVVKIEVFGEGLNQLINGNLIIFKRWIRSRKPVKIGDMVELIDEEENPVACGIWDKIGARILNFNECPNSLDDLIFEKFEFSKKSRERMGYENVYRLIHGDGDLFPGLIVDVYGPLAVIQSSSMAIDTIIPIIVKELVKVTGVDTVAEKSVQRVRSKSNLPPREKIHLGSRKEVIVEVDIEGIKYYVSLKSRKTGLYLDQRENRVYTRRFARGSSFLDLFSYTGGFGLNALHEGARHVTFVDKDTEALSALKKNLKLNNIDDSRVRIVKEDAFKFLRRSVKRDLNYEVTSVDPPALMDDYKDGLQRYKEVYVLSSQLSKDISVLSSCSRSMKLPLFISTVYDSVREPYSLLEVRGSAPDHPIRRGLEDYLKVAYVSYEG
ncbi:SAM-dependent methyltransferase [Ignicoccus islandicus DSM 13165]|uniref:SAM-dependent methyltransferase n=1 Tax=Ignicoccus islandicus DSM 13165 TaxID=940295 RepID=A0A0U3FMV1_9CREN|nr:class I SAM-dependent rRNA methyltransferase [Ignicoccus islandicus]ALU11711.1 SAM-dependent methyltransferase [Ignicoccus islandicus DSM 13165]